MSPIGIISFNSTSFTNKILNSNIVEYINLDVEVAGVSYADKTINELMEATEKFKEIPKTSQPPTNSYIAKYEEMLNKYEDVIVLTPEKGLSGTHQGAVVAKSMISDGKQSRLHIVETKSFAISEALLCDTAIDLIEEGKSVSETIETLEILANNISTYVIPGSFEHLRKSGRVNLTQATIGKLMMLKLLIHQKDETAQVYKKGRGFKKILKIIEEEILTRPNIKKIYITGLGQKENEYNMLKETLSSKCEVIEANSGSVIVAAHFGSESLGFLTLEE